MSVDSTELLSACKRIVRTHAADVVGKLPSFERAEFVENEAQSLAYSLAECAQDRIDDLRAETKA